MKTTCAETCHDGDTACVEPVGHAGNHRAADGTEWFNERDY